MSLALLGVVGLEGGAELRRGGRGELMRRRGTARLQMLRVNVLVLHDSRHTLVDLEVLLLRQRTTGVVLALVRLSELLLLVVGTRLLDVLLRLSRELLRLLLVLVVARWLLLSEVLGRKLGVARVRAPGALGVERMVFVRILRLRLLVALVLLRLLLLLGLVLVGAVVIYPARGAVAVPLSVDSSELPGGLVLLQLGVLGKLLRRLRLVLGVLGHRRRRQWFVVLEVRVEVVLVLFLRHRQMGA